MPAAVLLSGFTADWRGLLIGVNVGGLGTPIASLASLISLKAYLRSAGARPGRYLAVFLLANRDRAGRPVRLRLAAGAAAVNLVLPVQRGWDIIIRLFYPEEIRLRGFVYESYVRAHPPRVQKPARYTGGEYNAVVKDRHRVDTRYAFAFRIPMRSGCPIWGCASSTG